MKRSNPRNTLRTQANETQRHATLHRSYRGGRERESVADKMPNDTHTHTLTSSRASHDF